MIKGGRRVYDIFFNPTARLVFRDRMQIRSPQVSFFENSAGGLW
jgi:hypothetical protein